VTVLRHIVLLLTTIALCFATSSTVQAQHLNVPINREENLHLEKLINASDTFHHTGMKPYLRSRMLTTELADYDADSLKYYYWITEKLFRSHLITIESKHLKATIDPLFNAELGLDGTNRLLFKNTRGFLVEANLGDKVAFSSSFYDNQAVVPEYMHDFVDASGVIPGGGRTKPYRDTVGFDYAASYGYISYTPTRWLNLQFGHDKHFIGEGYRSLLLSDAAFNYPALKASAVFGKNDRFQYTSMLASLQSLQRFTFFTTPEASFKKKGGSFHYLSYHINKRWQVGLFEGMVWSRIEGDSSVAVDANYYVPLIGLNTALNGFDGKNNSVIGLTSKFKISKSTMAYGQLAIDDLANNRMGWQLGVKAFEPFGKKRLYLQAELNSVTPGTYSHENELQSYSHYNQSLAHPLGANFTEGVAIVDYAWGRRWFMSAKINYARFAKDTAGQNVGHNVLLSDTTLWEQETRYNAAQIFYEFKIGYTFNRHTNMRLYVGALRRNFYFRDENSSGTYFYIGLRTFLRNEYFDF